MRLKRRSLFSAEISVLPQNDDNLEQSRRLSVASPNVRSRQRMSTDAPQVLGSDMIVHFTQCLKLSSENKINPGNAFQLEMIDYMISMLSSNDSKMDNFQIASFTLDASTKIYASRVDKVHSDGLKIAGGLFKAVVRKEKYAAARDHDDGDSDDDGGPNGRKAESKATQRAHRRVRKIITEPESLNAPLQQNYKLHPSLLFMNTKFSDCRPGCVNLMPRISVVGDIQKLQFLCSEPALGSSEISTQAQLAEVPALSDMTKLKITSHKIEPADFLDDELATGMDQCDISEGLDLSVVTEKLKMDLQLENNFDDDACQVSAFETPEDGKSEPSNSPGNCKFDIRNHLSSKSQEYSYFNTEKLSLWRGPSHWKIFASKVRIEDTEKVKRKPKPKKKVKDLFPEEPEHNVDDKLQKGRLQKLTKKTTQKWQEIKVTSQPDVHYECSQFRRVYHNANFLVKFINERNIPMSEAEVVDDGDAVKYDYCNPNDTLEYCPNVPDCEASSSSTDDDEDGHELKEVNGNPVTPTRDERESTFQWKLLTPPTVATKISIPYAKESKKVDMARLKTTMWSILKQFSVCTSEKQNGKLMEIVGVLNKPEGTVTHFSKLLSETKAAWPDDTKAELSFAIVFQALLHLTNEKKMHLKSIDDLSDAIIFCPKSSSNV